MRPATSTPRARVLRLHTEAQLAAAWQERRYAAAALVDDRGRELRVVFPGRRWGGPGPDFKGAVLALPDGSLLRGDVEVHRRSSGWIQHGHAADPAYRKVVLHVVHVADRPTLDGRGQPIATVALEPLALLAPLPVVSPCLHDRQDVVGIVEEAGRQRFLARAARFEGDLAAVEPDQALWRGLLEAMGYSRNTTAFGRLADAAPWRDVRVAAATHGAAGAVALLLGTAGLLDDADPAEMATWDKLARPFGLRQQLAPSAWDRAQVRPGNDPARRCRGLGVLAARWAAATDSPLEMLRDSVRRAAAGSEGRPRRPLPLWRLLAVEPWIGRGRAQVAVVNVLLPLAYAAGDESALTLYQRLPGEPANRLTRYMADQLAPGRDLHFRTACQQQGLLHLFKTACAVRVCERCPAARTSSATA